MGGRRLTAILAADIAGYSALMGENEIDTVAALKGHQSIILPMIAGFEGRVIDTAGDGVLAEFSSVLNAVKCAVAIQETMLERNASVAPGRRMQFRIGINQGDVLFDNDRIFGDGINVAARLEGLCEPGGICISGKVYEEIKSRFQIRYEDLGPQTLKNIAEPVQAYRISVSGGPASNAGQGAKSPLKGSHNRLIGVGAVLVALCAVWFGWWAAPSTKTGPIVDPRQNFTGPRLAYVVGNREYTHLAFLGNPERDAALVSETLEQKGFKVVKRLNLDRAELIRAVEEFESTLSIVGGFGFFYYAGRAAYIDGQDILLPVDALADKAQSKIVGGVNFTQLTKEIQAKTTQRMTDNGYAVIYSASKGQVAADGPHGGDSPFTKQFVDALSYPDDELSDVFRRIGAGMEGIIPRQTPFFEDSRKVRFYFNKPDLDARNGIVKILAFDSCRDNPFELGVATK
jgi:class 3 adenylate cyclase